MVHQVHRKAVAAMPNPPENPILQLMPETIEGGFLSRLIKAKRELEDAIEGIMGAESEGDMKAAGELVGLPPDELENMQNEAFAALLVDMYMNAAGSRRRSNAGAGA
jgi:hypothetical protein